MRAIFAALIADQQRLHHKANTQLLSVDEWMTILGAFHQVGVKAVRLTGGEPLLYPHIEELLARIKQTGWFEDISMTTNGSLLAPRAEKLKELGLNSSQY